MNTSLHFNTPILMVSIAALLLPLQLVATDCVHYIVGQNDWNTCCTDGESTET